MEAWPAFRPRWRWFGMRPASRRSSLVRRRPVQGPGLAPRAGPGVGTLGLTPWSSRVGGSGRWP